MPTLPTGTLTLLFSDIEGSTSLLARLGDRRYAEILTEYRHLLLDVFARHGGEEVDSQGDGFFAVFRSARDALVAAIAVQQALAAHPWPAGVAVQARMGLHTGEPVAREAGYAGLGVHRAARISQMAAGGQLLISHTTADVVEGDLPPGTTLRDLGERRLKGLARPERVFQVIATGLATDLPPPLTAYKHLSLTRWPFPIVPEPEFCDFIADRKQLRTDIQSLLATFARQDASSIHLLWSWFGAGKTHTLFFVANWVSQHRAGAGSGLYSVYSEFPKSARSFVDLYRSFAQAVGIDQLVEAYLEISTASESSRLLQQMVAASPDLVSALQVLATGEPSDTITAMRWLRGEILPVSQLRGVGISQKIGSSEEASRILTALVQLLSLAARSQKRSGSRTIWLVDEFQRIIRLPSRVRDEISTGLHSTFNACPTDLSIVLSFSGKPQDALPPWFSPELRDRISPAKVMILPPMLPEEALEFIRDVLARFRPPKSDNLSAYFPFTEDSCRLIIDIIQKDEELKPRAIMHAFSAVLQEADEKMESQEIAIISPEFARRVLADRMPLTEPEEDLGVRA